MNHGKKKHASLHATKSFRVHATMACMFACKACKKIQDTNPHVCSHACIKPVNKPTFMQQRASTAEAIPSLEGCNNFFDWPSRANHFILANLPVFL